MGISMKGQLWCWRRWMCNDLTVIQIQFFVAIEIVIVEAPQNHGAFCTGLLNQYGLKFEKPL